MEEFDDLIPQPDADGSCDLAHRGWKVVDSVIWTLGAELLHLDLSFNRIEALPPDVGGLFLLRTLNISCNRVASIPQAILRCKRLRILKANGNALTSIPDEIAECHMLEQLYLSENQICEIPRSIGTLDGLEILTLQNNRLVELPAEVGLLVALKELNCTNNPDLRMVPEQLRSDAQMILWICKTKLDAQMEIDRLVLHNNDLEDVLRTSDEERLRLQDELAAAREVNVKLLKERPRLCLGAPRTVAGAASAACAIS